MFVWHTPIFVFEICLNENRMTLSNIIHQTNDLNTIYGPYIVTCSLYLWTISTGKKPWYTDAVPLKSEFDTKDVTVLLPPEAVAGGMHVWQSRVRGEWNGQFEPFACIVSRWSNSSQSGAMKNIAQRLWKQYLSTISKPYSKDTCPHFEFLKDAPPY